METLDHRTDPSKLWRTIKAIDGKSPSKQIANYFNRQFTTSKLGRHTTSSETRLVSREIKRKSLTSVMTFTTDQLITGISNCSNTKAFGPDKLSIFHLKNLGPKAIENLTTLFNDSVTSCQIPAIWKSSIVIPIPKPGKDSSLGTSYRPISLLCPSAKVMDSHAYHCQHTPQGVCLAVPHSSVVIGNFCKLMEGISMVAHWTSGNKIGNIMVVR